MTFTLDLPEKLLKSLRADAGAQGRPAEKIAVEYLAAHYFEEFEEEDEETAINAALDEVDAGKGRPLAEFAEELSARFAARYKAP